MLQQPEYLRESSFHVTNTTYSGLQEHRIIVYTATGQKAKPKVHLSTESTVTGNSSKTPEACRKETEEHKDTCHTTDTAMMRQLQQCKNGARCKLTVDQDRCLTHWLGLSAVALRLTVSQATVAQSEE
jgi:hypothetical protein